jgi:hypothetical protein
MLRTYRAERELCFAQDFVTATYLDARYALSRGWFALAEDMGRASLETVKSQETPIDFSDKGNLDLLNVLAMASSQ